MSTKYSKGIATNVFSWEFTGKHPSDDFLLRMAKIGVAVSYVSNEDNDYDGAILTLAQPLESARPRKMEYSAKLHPARVVWTERSPSGGRLLPEWDLDALIEWEWEDE